MFLRIAKKKKKTICLLRVCGIRVRVTILRGHVRCVHARQKISSFNVETFGFVCCFRALIANVVNTNRRRGNGQLQQITKSTRCPAPTTAQLFNTQLRYPPAVRVHVRTFYFVCAFDAPYEIMNERIDFQKYIQSYDKHCWDALQGEDGEKEKNTTSVSFRPRYRCYFAVEQISSSFTYKCCNGVATVGGKHALHGTFEALSAQ